MKSESVRALARARVAASSRSLSTARAVLRVLALLVERPEGVRADEVARSLGKSTSTAYYLLTSLCEEGFAVHESKGVYRPARGLEELTGSTEQSTPIHDGLAGTVDELFLRTRKRSYLGVVRKGRIEIVAFHGRQGVPRMPGLGSEIRDSAHALAMGKVVLSLLSSQALGRYIQRGLKAFTPHTIISPQALKADLGRVGELGFAVDREEFEENFCCVAAPIFDQQQRFVAALGLSTTSHIFDSEREALAATLLDVARAAASAASRQNESAVRSGARKRREKPRELQAVAENASFLPGREPELSLSREAV